MDVHTDQIVVAKVCADLGLWPVLRNIMSVPK
jgi:hypothetical protein